MLLISVEAWTVRTINVTCMCWWMMLSSKLRHVSWELGAQIANGTTRNLMVLIPRERKKYISILQQIRHQSITNLKFVISTPIKSNVQIILEKIILVSAISFTYPLQEKGPLWGCQFINRRTRLAFLPQTIIPHNKQFNNFQILKKDKQLSCVIDEELSVNQLTICQVKPHHQLA